MKDLTVKELFGLYDNRINVGDFKEADEFKEEIMSRFYKMEKEIDIFKTCRDHWKNSYYAIKAASNTQGN